MESFLHFVRYTDWVGKLLLLAMALLLLFMSPPFQRWIGWTHTPASTPAEFYSCELLNYDPTYVFLRCVRLDSEKQLVPVTVGQLP